MTTVIVGVILILLLFNDQGELNLWTGGTIGVGDEEKASTIEKPENNALERISKKAGVKAQLSFDTAPKVKEETDLRSINLIFDGLSTKIKVNEEELAMKGLKEVEMIIDNFEGEIEFNEVSISLTGNGEKMMVNGIEISTQGKIEISFDNLAYEKLKIEDGKFNDLEFGRGSGKLLVGEKMEYNLNNEKISITSFEGDLSVGMSEENLIVLDGELKGISVDGEFDLSLG
jgi:hypothetical protein